jgi:O-antigen/teichoic acid export membrane protein
MISKSFFKSSILFTLGGSLPMVAGIILLPFYTNYLSDVNYTQVLFYISISLLFQILFSFSIESYFGIKYSQLSEDPEKQKKFIGTVSLILLIIGIGLLILSALFGDLETKILPHNKISITYDPEKIEVEKILRIISDAKIQIRDISTRQPDLEEIFKHLIKSKY